MSDAEGPASLAGAIHDLHARLGSIRMAVTAVAGLELDAETRSFMLTTASEESVRAAAELAGLGALMTCLLDQSDVASCDVAAAFADAAEAAHLAGLAVDVLTNGPLLVDVRVARLRAVLPALIRLVGGAGGGVGGVVVVEGDRVHVQLRRHGPDSEDLPPIAAYLVDVLGAQRESYDEGLAFSVTSSG